MLYRDMPSRESFDRLSDQQLVVHLALGYTVMSLFKETAPAYSGIHS